jgi:hypothetical protein
LVFSIKLLLDTYDHTHVDMHSRQIIKKETWVGWWLTPIILATQEAEIRRIGV